MNRQRLQSFLHFLCTSSFRGSWQVSHSPRFFQTLFRPWQGIFGDPKASNPQRFWAFMVPSGFLIFFEQFSLFLCLSSDNCVFTNAVNKNSQLTYCFFKKNQQFLKYSRILIKYSEGRYLGIIAGHYRKRSLLVNKLCNEKLFVSKMSFIMLFKHIPQYIHLLISNDSKKFSYRYNFKIVVKNTSLFNCIHYQYKKKLTRACFITQINDYMVFLLLSNQ